MIKIEKEALVKEEYILIINNTKIPIKFLFEFFILVFLIVLSYLVGIYDQHQNILFTAYMTEVHNNGGNIKCYPKVENNRLFWKCDNINKLKS